MLLSNGPVEGFPIFDLGDPELVCNTGVVGSSLCSTSSRVNSIRFGVGEGVGSSRLLSVSPDSNDFALILLGMLVIGDLIADLSNSSSSISSASSSMPILEDPSVAFSGLGSKFKASSSLSVNSSFVCV